VAVQLVLRTPDAVDPHRDWWLGYSNDAGNPPAFGVESEIANCAGERHQNGGVRVSPPQLMVTSEGYGAAEWRETRQVPAREYAITAACPIDQRYRRAVSVATAIDPRPHVGHLISRRGDLDVSRISDSVEVLILNRRRRMRRCPRDRAYPSGTASSP
jgi:hypothetical protein